LEQYGAEANIAEMLQIQVNTLAAFIPGNGWSTGQELAPAAIYH
jgi:hypothetical protein